MIIVPSFSRYKLKLLSKCCVLISVSIFRGGGSISSVTSMCSNTAPLMRVVEVTPDIDLDSVSFMCKLKKNT